MSCRHRSGKPPFSTTVAALNESLFAHSVAVATVTSPKPSPGATSTLDGCNLSPIRQGHRECHADRGAPIMVNE
jgi:hypothetical protein